MKDLTLYVGGGKITPPPTGDSLTLVLKKLSSYFYHTISISEIGPILRIRILTLTSVGPASNDPRAWYLQLFINNL